MNQVDSIRPMSEVKLAGNPARGSLIVLSDMVGVVSLFELPLVANRHADSNPV